MRTITELLLLLLLPLSLWAGENISPLATDISGPLSFTAQAFDVIHYDAELDLTAAPGMKTTGICRITFLWTLSPDTNKFYFHLRGLKVDSVFYNNDKVSASQAETETSPTFHYEITPPGGKTGDTVLLTIFYSGTFTPSDSWGGVHNSLTSLFAMGVGFRNNYVSATQHWLPCYDHPSDKATFEGRFKVKRKHNVASIGLLEDVAEQDSFKIYHWKHDYPCSTYLMTFAADEYDTISYNIRQDLTGVIYTRPELKEKTKYTFSLLPKMVEAFEARFGKYPFDKVGYVNTPIGSMEHQTMISYDLTLINKGYNQKDTLNLTAAHELSHQWFGDLATCRDFRDAWLNEGFAKYCEAIWLEYMFGYGRYISSVSGIIDDYLTIASSEGILPLYDFPRKNPSSNYPTTIYYKGAAVVAMIRQMLGDDMFFEAVRDYLDKAKYSTVTSSGLQSVLEQKTGQNLEWFFNQWICGKGYPVLDVRIMKSPVAGGLERDVILIDQVQPAEWGVYTNLPLEIGFRQESGEYVYKSILIKEKHSVFTFDSIPATTSLTFNEGPSFRTLVDFRSITTSIGDLGSKAEPIAEVSPNPASDVLRVSVRSQINEFDVKIIDLFGNLIFNKEYGGRLAEIPLSSIRPGVYIIDISSGKWKIVRKIQVIR